MQLDTEILSILTAVGSLLGQKRVRAFLVGGFVRDIILGRRTADIDLAIDTDPLEIGPQIAEALKGKYVCLDDFNRIARVILPKGSDFFPPGYYLDFSLLANGDIQKDLARRDFTIDAMAIELHSFLEDPLHADIFDPFDGRKAIEERVVRAVAPDLYQSDPARLLRTLRLSAEMNFTVSSQTEILIRQNASRITEVAPERNREELVRILATQSAGRFIRRLDELGLLGFLIPELEPSRGVEQPKEHFWDVLNHSIETVRATEFILHQDSWEYADSALLKEVPWSDTLQEHFDAVVGSGTTRQSLLKLAALLHDIAKPETKILADNRLRFYGHTEQGARVSAGLLERLRFSVKEIKTVELMVRYHLRPTQMSHEGLPTSRAIYRYFRDTGESAIDILFLSLADHLAARGPNLDRQQWGWHLEQTKYVLAAWSQGNQAAVPPPRLLDGHDLMREFDLKPGPRLREILEALKEAQAIGDLTSRAEALSYVKNRLL